MASNVRHPLPSKLTRTQRGVVLSSVHTGILHREMHKQNKLLELFISANVPAKMFFLFVFFMRINISTIHVTFELHVYELNVAAGGGGGGGVGGGVTPAKRENTVGDHFNQSTNRVIVATVETFYSRLCGTKGGYFE